MTHLPVLYVCTREGLVKALIRDVGAGVVAHILVGFKDWVNCGVKVRKKGRDFRVHSLRVHGSWLSLSAGEDPGCRERSLVRWATR